MHPSAFVMFLLAKLHDQTVAFAPVGGRKYNAFQLAACCDLRIRTLQSGSAGSFEGLAVGVAVVGVAVGIAVGAGVGLGVGLLLGMKVGLPGGGVGSGVGPGVGTDVGILSSE